MQLMCLLSVLLLSQKNSVNGTMIMHLISTLSGGPGRVLTSVVLDECESNKIVKVAVLSGEQLSEGLLADLGDAARHLLVFKRKSKYSFFELARCIFAVRKNAQFLISYDFASHVVSFLSVVFTSAHWMPSFHGLESAFAPFRRVILRVILFRATKVIVPSRVVRNKLVFYKLFEEKKIVIINNGVRIPSKKNLRSPPCGGVKLVCLANFYSLVKGQRYVLEALCNLPSSFHLTLIGDGKHLREMMELSKSLKLDNRVNFQGNVSHRNIHRELVKYDVMVVPSESESFCIAAIEGMAAGLPVVASDVGGLREIVDTNCGMLFPVADSRKMSEVIYQICTNPKIWTKLHKGALIQSKKFTEKSMVRKYSQLLDEMGTR